VAFKPQKNIGATLKRILNGFGIPNPELLNPDFGTGFGIYKSRGIGIPLGAASYVFKPRSDRHSLHNYEWHPSEMSIRVDDLLLNRLHFFPP
jgi:hypothetical protein